MHRPGIEPGPPAWQASILPLNHRCDGFCIFTNPYLFATVLSLALASSGNNLRHDVDWR